MRASDCLDKGVMNVARRLIALTLVCALACVVGVSLAGCGSGASSRGEAENTSTASQPGADDELVVAIAGMITPKDALEYYLEFSEYVGAKAGKRVRLIHKSDYAQVNKLLEEGKVDVAFVCSGPYVTGRDRFGLELVAAPVVDGVQTYRSYTIVPRSSDATSLESLRGKTFAFTDPESNSGRIIPTYTLGQMGATPEAFFKEVFFSYGHDNSIKLVATGKADGAAVDSLIWEYDNDLKPEYTAKTKIIAKSETCAIPPVVVRPGLDPELKKRISDAFLGAEEDPEGAAILAKMRIEKFAPIEDSAYDSIRAMETWIDQNPMP